MKSFILFLLPLLSGAALPLAFAPFNYTFLSIVSPLILLGCLQKTSPTRAFWWGWLYGLGMFGVGVSWVQVSIYVYGHTSWLLSILLTLLFVGGLAFFMAIQSWTWVRFFRDQRGAVLLAFPALWILFEIFRGWVLTGFPWLYLGYSHVDSLLSGYLPLVGVFGVSGLTVFSSSLVFMAFKRKQTAIGMASFLIVIWGGGWMLQKVEWVEEKRDPISVALVQGNVPQDEKWQPQNKISILKKYLELTEPAWGKKLIIWPENAIPFFSHQIQDFLNVLSQKAEEHGSTVVLGIPIEEPEARRYFNGILLLGEGQGTYLKHRLVPFGEYIPFESWLRGVIAFFDLPMSDFSKGPFAPHPLSVGTLFVGMSVCYEIAYSLDMARQAKDSNILVTLSDDSWFGHSIGPKQHLQIARARALETGKPILRATNTGITAVIDHQGRVRQHLPQEVAQVLTGSVVPTEGTTPYVRFITYTP